MDTVSPLPLTAREVEGAVAGRLVSGSGEALIRRLAIDSRSVEPGDLFVALRGERVDGHDFVAQAFDRGAMGAVVSRLGRALEATPHPVVIEVEDTTRALQQLGSYVRGASGAVVVAITGSIGKTTTKEIAADFLATRLRVYRSVGNLNSQIGLPLSLFELRYRPEVAVVEIGMSRAGEISRLVAIARPLVRVWTNVAEVHSAFFDSIDAIADAKAEIMEGATESDLLVANADDRRVMARARRFPGSVMTFGMHASADVMARDVRGLGLEGTQSELHTPAGRAHLQVPLLGRGNLANVLAAVCVALRFQIPLSGIVEQARDLRPARHRGERIDLRDGITLIDDSYNSSPAAVMRALELLGDAETSGRRLAVLGEMLELGPRSVALHRECGRAVAATGVDLLITIGGESAGALADGALEAGMTTRAVHHVATSEEASVLVTPMLEPRDLVLIKGSRGVRTDTVVDHLKAEVA